MMETGPPTPGEGLPRPWFVASPGKTCLRRDGLCWQQGRMSGSKHQQTCCSSAGTIYYMI